jgi:hypothetical protein
LATGDGQRWGLSPITRSAKELIAEMDGDTKAGDVIMNCMLRG